MTSFQFGRVCAVPAQSIIISSHLSCQCILWSITMRGYCIVILTHGVYLLYAGKALSLLEGEINSLNFFHPFSHPAIHLASAPPTAAIIPLGNSTVIPCQLQGSCSHLQPCVSHLKSEFCRCGKAVAR